MVDVGIFAGLKWMVDRSVARGFVPQRSPVWPDERVRVEVIEDGVEYGDLEDEEVVEEVDEGAEEEQEGRDGTGGDGPARSHGEIMQAWAHQYLVQRGEIDGDAEGSP
jgi:hypothetical protein